MKLKYLIVIICLIFLFLIEISVIFIDLYDFLRKGIDIQNNIKLFFSMFMCITTFIIVVYVVPDGFRVMFQIINHLLN